MSLDEIKRRRGETREARDKILADNEKKVKDAKAEGGNVKEAKGKGAKAKETKAKEAEEVGIST